MAAKRVTVYYDGWCPLCTRIRGGLERLDWLGRLTFRSMREDGVPEQLGVPAADLAARMHARHNGAARVAAGIEAVLLVAAQVPAFWPLWPGLWLATALGLGQPAYDWVAGRRTITPVGHCESDACPIHRQGGPESGQPR